MIRLGQICNVASLLSNDINYNYAKKRKINIMYSDFGINIKHRKSTCSSVMKIRSVFFFFFSPPPTPFLTYNDRAGVINTNKRCLSHFKHALSSLGN